MNQGIADIEEPEALYDGEQTERTRLDRLDHVGFRPIPRLHPPRSDVLVVDGGSEFN